MTVSAITAFHPTKASMSKVSPAFASVCSFSNTDSIQFSGIKKNVAPPKNEPSPSAETSASSGSRVWAGVKLAGLAGLGLVFAGPIGAALGGITMMDMVWGLVVPTLLEEGAYSKAFTQVKEGLGKVVYTPLKGIVEKIGHSWVGRKWFKIESGKAAEWAEQKLAGINPARLHEILADRAKNKTTNKGVVGSLMNLKNHFKSLQQEHGMQWAEAMTHTVYSGLVIARNRMTIRGFWTGLRNEFKGGLIAGVKSLFTRRFWSGLKAFKNGFSLFKIVKSLLIGNIVLKLAIEALHSAATLFLGKGRWEQIRKDHDHKIDPLDDKLELTETSKPSSDTATNSNETAPDSVQKSEADSKPNKKKK